LITGDIYGNVVVWRINNNNKLTHYYSIKDHHKQITSIFISYDLRCLFTSSMDGSVFGYNIITGRKMKVFYHPKLLPINNVIVSTSPLPVVVLFSSSESIIYCYSINGQLIQRVHEK
jgi:WD40 repeat protein